MHCAPFLLTMQIIFASVSYRRVVADLRVYIRLSIISSIFKVFISDLHCNVIDYLNVCIISIVQIHGKLYKNAFQGIIREIIPVYFASERSNFKYCLYTFSGFSKSSKFPNHPHKQSYNSENSS